MLLDTVLAKFREARNFLVQPTDNAFAGLVEFTKKLHDGLAKLAEFTKEVMKEEEKEEETPAKSKEGKKKAAKEPTPKDKKVAEHDRKASEQLAKKLEACYEFQKELQELASVPVHIVSRVNTAANIKTDTPPEVVNSGLRMLLTVFNHMLETINHGDPRNQTSVPQVDPLLEHPHARALAELAQGKGPSGTKVRNRITPAAPGKTIKRTLTSRRS